MADETPKATPKDAAKVFDVARPGKSPASATSRPVIVGHKPQVHDPLLSPSAEQSLLTRSKQKTVVAPAAAPASVTPEDAKAVTAPASVPENANAPASVAGDVPIADSPSSPAPMPDATSVRDLDDAAAPMAERSQEVVPGSLVAATAPKPSPVSVDQQAPGGMTETATQTEPSAAADAAQGHLADLPEAPSPLPPSSADSSAISAPGQAAPAQTPELISETSASSTRSSQSPQPDAQAAQNSPSATPGAAPASSALGFDELDLSQVSKPTFSVKPAVSQSNESEADDALLAGMSNAPLIEPNSIVVSHHTLPRGFKKRARAATGGPQTPLLTAHSVSRKRRFPWLGLLLTLLLLVLIAVIVLDLLLDGGFMSDIFRGHTLPHTHFFKT